MYRIYLAVALLTLSVCTYAEDTKAVVEAEQKEVLQEIELEIERARQQIDSAARELANLHKKKYAMGSSGNKAMLGVLLDGDQGGLEIIGVTPGGGAAAAGMQAGDQIIAIGGVSVEDEAYPRKALGGVMQGVAPGDDVTVVYVRDGQQVETTITTQARAVHMIALLDERLGEKLGEEALALEDLKIELRDLAPEISAAIAEISEIDDKVWAQKASASHALMPVSGDLAKYFDVDEGVVVRKVAKGSELKAGDVLLEVAATEVTGVTQAAQLLDNLDGEADAQVKRHGRKRAVTVQPEDFAGVSQEVVKRVIRVGQGGQQKDIEINVEVVDD